MNVGAAAVTVAAAAAATASSVCHSQSTSTETEAGGGPPAAPLPHPLIHSHSSSSEVNNTNSISSNSSSSGPLSGGVGGSSGQNSSLNGERIIPFLRQLTQMLRNNTELISFIPGRSTSSSIVHGQIVVHDRRRVQNEVLPIYFNHASFASLRRQLSYFSFVRVGKGRQQAGVIYTNENVVELQDICKLRRRRSGVPVSAIGGSVAAVAVGGGVVRRGGDGVDGERAREDENNEQGWGGRKELRDDGINADHLAIPTKATAIGDELLLPPSPVDDSNDDDRIASAMLSGALHAATDNCHSNQRASLAASGSNSSSTTTNTIHSSSSRGGSSGDEDDDDDVSCPSPQSPSSFSSHQKLCRHQRKQQQQQQPLTTTSILQKKETKMAQVHQSKHPFIHHYRNHPNRRLLPLAMTSSSPSSIDVNSNNISNSGGSSNITNTNINLRTIPKNKNSQRHCCSSVVVPAKDRARFDRLLSINSIVPFIHLPAPASSTTSSSLRNSASFNTSVAKGVVEKGGGGGGLKLKRTALKNHEHGQHDDEDITAPSPPKKSKIATSMAPVTNSRVGTRERSSSDCVITALLALGADRQ